MKRSGSPVVEPTAIPDQDDFVAVDQVYRTYWARKRLLAQRLPRFGLVAWWPCGETTLCPAEQVLFNAVAQARCLLDVGAGDLRIQRKFLAAGFSGTYLTQDVGNEFSYDFTSLDSAIGPFDAILCLDVLEHLTLNAGLKLLDTLAGRLAPDGVLAIQTPNARCVRHPSSWDMTHLHCYNLPDLWAFLTSLGLETTGVRVVFETAPEQRGSFWSRPLRDMERILARWLITRWLGLDYAENMILLARKPRDSNHRSAATQ